MSIQTIKDNSQSLVAKVIVGVIVVTFALFGVDAIMTYSGGGNDVASVNGEEISEVEVARTAELMRRQLLSQLGENADPSLLDEQLIRQRALDSLIARKLILQEVEEAGLHVADQRVDAEIIQTEAFQVGGVFDRDVYGAAVRNIGLTPLEYKSRLTQDLLGQQPVNALTESGFVTDAEINYLIRLDRQTRNIAYTQIKAEELKSEVEVEEAQKRAVYESSPERFTTQEKVSLNYLELKRSDFYDQVEVDPVEVEQRYQQEVDSYADSEERRAAHILIEISDDKDEQQAQQEMAEVLAKLEAGEAFDELARTYSADPGSAENGGDLGFASRGVYVPEFEEALYRLSPGETSEVVTTQYGLHLIKLLEQRKPEPPSFDEMKAELEQELRHQKAETLFVAAAEELQNDSFSAGDLREPADNLGLEIQETPLFAREANQNPSQNLSGVAANPIVSNLKVQRVAFSDEVLQQRNNSDMIEITQDHVVVVRVKEHQPAKLRPYDEVAEEIEAELIAEQAASKAAERGGEIVAALRGDESPAKVAETYEFEWTIKDKVRRNSNEVDAQITEAAFKLPKPPSGDKSVGSLEMANGDFLVLTLTRVYEENTDFIDPREIAAMRQFLSSQYGNSDFSEFQKSLELNADITKY